MERGFAAAADNRRPLVRTDKLTLVIHRPHQSLPTVGRSPTASAAGPTTDTAPSLPLKPSRMESLRIRKKTVRFATTPCGKPLCTVHDDALLSSSSSSLEDDSNPCVRWFTSHDFHQMMRAQMKAVKQKRRDPQCVEIVERMYASGTSHAEICRAMDQLSTEYPDALGLERFISKRVIQANIRQRQVILRHLKAEQKNKKSSSNSNTSTAA